MADDFKAQSLTFRMLSVVLSNEGHQCLGKADEADGKCPVFQNFQNLVIRL